MPSDRDAFEKWAEANGYAAFNDDDNEYSNADTHHAWMGWQAGAAAEREICAKICEEHEKDTWDPEALACAGKIRDRSAP